MLSAAIPAHDESDRIVRHGAGFRMGPFELMDLIGIDVNFAVARSFWEQSFGEPRWRPVPLHERMVASGRLGRKTGRGFYSYETGEPHRPRRYGSAACRGTSAREGLRGHQGDLHAAAVRQPVLAGLADARAEQGGTER